MKIPEGLSRPPRHRSPILGCQRRRVRRSRNRRDMVGGKKLLHARRQAVKTRMSRRLVYMKKREMRPEQQPLSTYSSYPFLLTISLLLLYRFHCLSEMSESSGYPAMLCALTKSSMDTAPDAKVFPPLKCRHASSNSRGGNQGGVRKFSAHATYGLISFIETHL